LIRRWKMFTSTLYLKTKFKDHIMLKNLLRFEWYYHTHRPLFYVTAAAFAILGFLAGYMGSIFPNMHINSPYQVSYLTGILSLAAIFSITLSVAQTILREAETKFDAIVHATPVRKGVYLFSRVGGVAAIGIISFAMASAGMLTGHLLSGMPQEKLGPFQLINYAWPLLVLAVPNIILCIAILCGTAWITRSKLTIYVAGLLIYVLYIIGSIFGNSPLIAGSAPASPEAMALFAKLDPLGMAAFFEQTKYWTAQERNSLQLSLSGNFLFNRVLWLGVSLLILGLSYARFSFRKLNTKPAKKQKAAKDAKFHHAYKTLVPSIHSWKHNYASFRSFFKLDVVSVLKGIPFLLVLILWTALLGIEMMNAVNGDPRLGERYATTGLLVTVIMEVMPFFSLLVILFYSSELLWRSKAVNMHGVESSTPVHPAAVFLSKLASLSVIPFFLLVVSCLMGIIVQLMNGVLAIELGLYASLVYYVWFPLLLCIALIGFIQAAISNKYAGLVVAAIVVLLTSSGIGRMIGMRHPLLRFANVMTVKYEEMNGFGAYTTAFNWQMLCWFGLAVCMVIAGSVLWNRKAVKFNRSKLFITVAFGLLFLGSAGYIFYQTNVRHPYLTSNDINNWKQSYENNFKRYANLRQPAITNVKTAIDLYPADQRYNVKGEYQLVNNTSTAIDSLLIYIDREVELKSMSIQNARLVKDESEFGHYWYVMNNRLHPGQSTTMQFSFTSGWSPFRGHAAFNSIIDNGSFMRISNYFPSFGYEAGNEITSSLERQKRKMPQQDELKKLEAPTPEPYDYRFMMLDAVVSTSGDQIAVGSGDLVKQWSANGRNYFHYTSDRPMPFRFAFSSARYAVKKSMYENIPIEVYYDARHAANVDSLILNAQRTLAYCNNNFGAYPHKVVRFAEVSGFAEGFAATAYPGVIYMKEDGGFYNNLASGSTEDVINQLAGHELSHQWWGSASLNPEHREGGWILTETLAKYTELMLYRHAHGPDATLNIVKLHLDQYFSNRSFSRETPLIKTSFETPHLPYNKGTVVMHQLQQLIGEKAVNTALSSLLALHAYPKAPPTAQDLLNEIYKASPQQYHGKIDELFRQIITHESKIETAVCNSVNNAWQVSFTANVQKFVEDGLGKRSKATPDSTAQVGIYTEDGQMHLFIVNIVNNHITGKAKLATKPVRVVLDPYLKTMDAFLPDNEKACE
jgi:ABC-2 type transport system permease protein